MSHLIWSVTVAEAAFISKPEPDRAQIVKAFVILAPGHAGSQELVRELSLLTAKPYIYVFNCDSDELADSDVERNAMRESLRFIADNWLGGKRISPIPFDNPPLPGTKRSYE